MNSDTHIIIQQKATERGAFKERLLLKEVLRGSVINIGLRGKSKPKLEQYKWRLICGTIL